MPHDGLSFVQISDSHIGFNKPANENVIATLEEAVARINALPSPPAFLIHTGDISHLSKPEEFDAVDQILKTVKTDQVFFVPGEHDVLGDNGKQYLERYGKQTKGDGWFSFDQKGVHFIGLVNVMNLKAGGLGSLGNASARMAGKGRRRGYRAARPSWFSRTCHSGWSIRIGAGAPTTASRRWAI